MGKTTIIIVSCIFLLALVGAIESYQTYSFEKSTYQNVTKETCVWEMKKEYATMKQEELKIIIDGMLNPSVKDFYNKVCSVKTIQVEIFPSKDDIIAGLKAEITKLNTRLNDIVIK
jgi:hypothetical protein